MNQPRQRLMLALLAAGSVFFALGLSELALRLYGRYGGALGQDLANRDPLRVLVEPHGEEGYKPRPNTALHYPNGTVAHVNALGYRGPLVQRPKPAGTTRIVLLGGSTTHGWHVDDSETIDAHMRAIFAERYPDRPIEVINLGYDGYDAWQLLQRLRTDGFALEPDAIIVNSGINDVRSARFENLGDPDSRTLIWFDVLARLREEARDGPSVQSRVKHYLYVSRLPGFVLEHMRRRRQTHRPRPTTPTRDGADVFERNLRRIADSVHAHGIPLVFSTPPSSLRLLYAPEDQVLTAYWLANAAVTADYRDTLAARMSSAAAELRDAGYAVRHIRPAAEAADFLDDAHLNSSGNRAVAESFVAALEPLLGLRNVPEPEGREPGS